MMKIGLLKVQGWAEWSSLKKGHNVYLNILILMPLKFTIVQYLYYILDFFFFLD